MNKQVLSKYRDERYLRADLGVNLLVFNKLFEVLEVLYEEKKETDYQKAIASGKRKRKRGGGRKSVLKTIREKLIFILSYLKKYPSYDALSVSFEMGRSTAHKQVQGLLPLLRESLDELTVLPQRVFESVEEFEHFFKEKDIEQLLIDVTERPHFRPQDKDLRDPLYSGKQKAFTMKNTVISDLSKFIWFLGLTTQGSMHDFRLLQLELDPKKDWFAAFEVMVDLGYIGMDKSYKIKELFIPHKRSSTKKGEKKQSLTTEQKADNKHVNKVRVLVENAIGGMKRIGILTQTFRNRIIGMDDLVVEIGAGLWNLHLSLKNT